MIDLKNMSWDDKLDLAMNPKTAATILGELVKDENIDIRSYTASNPNTSLGALLTLAQDNYWGVRVEVVLNPNSSSKILVKVFEYEKNLSEPHEAIIGRLYIKPKLPHIAKIIIETLFKEML